MFKAINNTRINTMKNIFDIIKPPFKYDEYGQMIFDEQVLPIQTRTTPSAIEMALRFKYEEEKAEITCG